MCVCVCVCVCVCYSKDPQVWKIHASQALLWTELPKDLAKMQILKVWSGAWEPAFSFFFFFFFIYFY